MPFSKEDKALMKNLYRFKQYGSRRIVTEFSKKNWTLYKVACSSDTVYVLQLTGVDESDHFIFDEWKYGR